MKAGWFAIAGVLGLLAGCKSNQPPQTPKSSLHYVRESAWQGHGVWFYPSDTLPSGQTGLASVYPDDTVAHETTDGEIFDQQAMAAGHQTVPLPAILRVTNLQNGRQILVRANDRGPATPHRVIELTTHAAERLGIASGQAVPVRIDAEQASSQTIAQALGGGAPKLAIESAPIGNVQVEDLATHNTRQTSAGLADSAQAVPADQAVPDQTWQVAPAPGPLWIDAGIFSTARYAQQRQLVVQGRIQTIGHGRYVQYQVRLGPFYSVTEADAALDRVLAVGVSDARIVAVPP